MRFATWGALDLVFRNHYGGGLEKPREIQEGEGRFGEGRSGGECVRWEKGVEGLADGKTVQAFSVRVIIHRCRNVSKQAYMSSCESNLEASIMYIFHLSVQGHCLGHACDVNENTATVVALETAVWSRSNQRLVVW